MLSDSELEFVKQRFGENFVTDSTRIEYYPGPVSSWDVGGDVPWFWKFIATLGCCFVVSLVAGVLMNAINRQEAAAVKGKSYFSTLNRLRRPWIDEKVSRTLAQTDSPHVMKSGRDAMYVKLRRCLSRSIFISERTSRDVQLEGDFPRGGNARVPESVGQQWTGAVLDSDGGFASSCHMYVIDVALILSEESSFHFVHSLEISR